MQQGLESKARVINKVGGELRHKKTSHKEAF